MANETDPLIDLVQQDDSYPAPLLRAIKGYHNLAGINERTRLSIDFSFDYQNKSFFRDLLALVTLAEENEKIIFDLAWLNDNLEQIRLKESLNGEDIQKLKEICARANEDPEYLLGHISIHINHNLGRQTDLLIKAYLYTIASVAVSGGGVSPIRLYDCFDEGDNNISCSSTLRCFRLCYIWCSSSFILS